MKNWEKLDEKVSYKGYRKMLQKTFRLSNGKVMDFDIVSGHSFVSVATFTEDKEVVLVKQYRPGPEEFQYSFAEGVIDEGESPETAALRELREETGYEAGEIFFLKKSNTAYNEGSKFCFVAINCKKVGEQRLDDTEVIDVETFSLDEFLRMLRSNQVSDLTGVDTAFLALDKLGWL